MADFLSLFSKERAMMNTIDDRNAMARGVVYDPARGIRDLLYNPQSTIIAGGGYFTRMAIASALLKSYADQLPVIYIHCGSVFSQKFAASGFAMQRGGVVTIPPDPLACYSSKRAAIYAIEEFANSSGSPLSGKAHDCLEFMTDALMKFGESLTIQNLNELFENPPAKVLLALLSEQLISRDEFDMETEHMSFFIEEYASARRVISLMSSLFSTDNRNQSVVLNELIDDNRLLSLDYSIPTHTATLMMETVLQNYSEALRRKNKPAVLLIEDVSSGSLPFLDKLTAIHSSQIIKIIVHSDIAHVNPLTSVWNATPNKIIFSHPNGADAVSELFGNFTKQTICNQRNKSTPFFLLFPTTEEGVSIAPQVTQRILPEEIRSLSENECFIQTETLPYILKTMINLSSSARRS